MTLLVMGGKLGRVSLKPGTGGRIRGTHSRKERLNTPRRIEHIARRPPTREMMGAPTARGYNLDVCTKCFGKRCGRLPTWMTRNESTRNI